MDWFRWHHGSVTDPKFQLVAKKAGASVAEVIAVWASLLEAASLAELRGNPGEIDFEALDCALGMDDGKAASIYGHMAGRGVVAEDGRITAWDKRQPKREDESANDRKRRQREREHELALSGHDESRDVTQESRDVTPGHARLDKRREEEEHPSSKLDLFASFWTSYPRKVGKDAARKAFAKRRVDEGLLAAMVSAIQTQGLAEKCARGESQFVPHPATWLNEGRWQDEDGPAANDDPYGVRTAL